MDMQQPMALGVEGAGAGEIGPFIRWKNRPPVTYMQMAFGFVTWGIIIVQMGYAVISHFGRNTMLTPKGGCPSGYTKPSTCVPGHPFNDYMCWSDSLCQGVQTCFTNSFVELGAGEATQGMSIMGSFGAVPGATALMPLSFVFGLGFVYLVRLSPSCVCWSALTTMTLMPALLWIFLLTQAKRAGSDGSPSADLLILSGVMALALILLRNRINKAITMIGIAVKCVTQTPSILMVAAGIKVIWVAYALFYLWSLISSSMNMSVSWDPKLMTCEVSSGTFGPVFFSYTFVFVSLFFQNVELMATAVGVGHWYFGAQDDAPGVPALEGAKWAFTTSSGAVGQASLIMAIVNWVNKQAGKWSCGPVTLVAKCVMWCIGEAINALSRFSLIAHAYYGGGFYQAAKNSWRILKDELGDAVTTNNVAVTVMVGCTSFITILCTYLALWIYGLTLGGEYNVWDSIVSSDAGNSIWAVLGLSIVSLLVSSKPLHFIVILVFVDMFVNGATFSTAWYGMIGGTIFVTAVCSIVLRYFAMVVIHASDAVFFCYAVEKHTGKVQERHEELYGQLSNQIVLVQAVPVQGQAV